MKSLALAVYLFMLAAGTFAQNSSQESASWKTATFASSVDAVYAAAEKAIAKKHEVKSTDPVLRIVRFHVGTTAWSWGYNMSLSVEDAGNGASRANVEIEKSGGPALSWGSGKKEVGKIFDLMKKELSAKRGFTDEPAPQSLPQRRR